MSSKPYSRHLLYALLVVIAAIAGGATIGIAVTTTQPAVAFIAFGAGLCGILVVAAIAGIINRHFVALDRLRGAVIAAMAPEAITLPEGEWREEREILDVHDAVNGLIARRRALRKQVEDRLAAVLSSVAEAVVVITEDGQVSLVNAEAEALLGAERIAIGTSAFAALRRSSVVEAMTKAKAGSRGIDVDLETVDGNVLQARVSELEQHGGAIISFRVDSLERRATFSHNLTLHDRPPPPQAVNEESLLADAAFLVVDTETTGLNVETDRIVSVGGVRMHGPHIYRSENIDVLVNPNCPIPAASTKIHGITDSMVKDAKSFESVWPDLKQKFGGMIIVGHHIAFDVAHLRRATRQADEAWDPAYVLDTLLLMAVLEPGFKELGLEAVAKHFGVDVHGRHTALGDCLVTAEVFSRQIARLEHAGIRTVGEAVAYQQKATKLVDMQRLSGWHDEPRNG